MKVVINKDKSVYLYQLIRMTEVNFDKVTSELEEAGLTCVFDKPDWKTWSLKSLVHGNVSWLE